MRAIHGSRRRPFEVDALAVISTAVARTLELVFAELPVWSAAEVGAARVDDEQAVGRTVYPDAIFLLPFGGHAQIVIRGIANLENGRRLEQRSRQKKTQKGQEPGAQKASDGAPHQTAALLVKPIACGTYGRHTASGRSLGSAHGGSANVVNRLVGNRRRRFPGNRHRH